MPYVSAPIVKVGDKVRFLIELTGTIVDPGPLTKEQNKLGLLPPKVGDPIPENLKATIEHPVLGTLRVDAYFVMDCPSTTLEDDVGSSHD